MTDKKKESTPPPLLLMQASEGLNLSVGSGASLLMPVAQGDSAILQADEGGEEDSFVGQSAPPQFNLFQGAPPPVNDPFSQIGSSNNAPFGHPHPNNTDPFANISQPSIPPPAALPTFSNPMKGPPVSSPPRMPPPMSNTPPPPSSSPALQMGPPPTSSVAPPAGANVPNFHRVGKPRYAAPPPGTYASEHGPAIPGASFLPPSERPFPATLPVSGGPPTDGQDLPYSHPPPTTSMPSQATGVDMTQNSGLPYGGPTMPYIPVQNHWFYCKHIGIEAVWVPFSIEDSIKLEESFRQGHGDNCVVCTDGGRYDVDIIEETRTPVYWEEPVTKVRRCSWFYKPEGGSRFVPYEKHFAEKLEEEYKNALINNQWHKRLDFPGGETIVMHNPNVIVNFKSTSLPDQWGTTQGDERPRVVKRGVDETFEDIKDGEPTQIDHVVFVVHGIGSTCDLRFRNITECEANRTGNRRMCYSRSLLARIDDFRAISLQIMDSHFKVYQDEGRIGRVEFLPVRWHSALHGEATGVDRKLKAITLKSIGKLRNFTNDTLLDILFYASPTYAQKIADTVGAEINRLFDLFLQRNPHYRGGFSLAGHSLGSLIMFDMLSHQRDPNAPVETPQDQPDVIEAESSGLITPTNSLDDLHNDRDEESTEPEETLEQVLEKLGLGSYTQKFEQEQIDVETLAMCEESDIKEMGLPMGPRKKLQGYIKDCKEKKTKEKKQAEEKGRREAESRLQEAATAAAAVHKAVSPSRQNQIITRDPLLRSMSNTSVDYVHAAMGTGLPFVKYPQLKFMPANFFALGSPIAMFLTVRGVEDLGEDFQLPTCPGFFNIFHPFDPVAYRLEPLVSKAHPEKAVLIPHHKGRKRLHLELKESLMRMGTDIKQKMVDYVKSAWTSVNAFAKAHKSDGGAPSDQEVDSVISQLAKDEEDKYETSSITSSMVEDEMPIGHLNQSRRIDYVLQEKPIESFNDYIFALGSHLCYWESEDTVLLLLKEIYALEGIAPVKPGTVPYSPGHRIAPPPMAGPPGTAVQVGGSNFGAPPPGSQFPPQFPVSSAARPIGDFPASSGAPPTSNFGAPPTSNFPGPPPAQNFGPPPRMGFVPK